MSKLSDSVWVIWKEPESRRNYIIGTIKKCENGYIFFYDKDISDAEKVGFTLFLSFKDKDKIYESDILFPVFSSRLPDRKRKDITSILKKYGMEEYDEFELIKHGAEIPIDNLKFVSAAYTFDDILGKTISLAGVRHYIGCKSKRCGNTKIDINDKIKLEKEPDNDKDEFAVKALHNGKTIGYIPRYYNKLIWEIIDVQNVYAVVAEVKKVDCDNCIRIIIKQDEYK